MPVKTPEHHRDATPGNFGYRLPAEWEPHESTWITWPHTPRGAAGHPHWPYTFFRQNIVRHWARMTHALASSEEVNILVQNGRVRRQAAALLEEEYPGLTSNKRVNMHEVPTNWPWIRDYGPLTLLRDRTGDRLMTNWEFNGWGGEWAHDRDNAVPRSMSSISGITRYDMCHVLEGGSIDVNGKGLLLTTEACLLDPHRTITTTEKRTKEDMQRLLCDTLGVEEVTWLPGSVRGDHTGHVDVVARFLNEDTIMAMVAAHRRDANFGPLQENLRILKRMRTAAGKQFTVVDIPLPASAKLYGQILPMGYANFYIANTAVLAPTYRDRHDQRALDVLGEAFPDRSIVPLDSRDLIWGMGSYHCLTMQVPAAPQRALQK